jgi:hypothetical protein
MPEMSTVLPLLVGRDISGRVRRKMFCGNVLRFSFTLLSSNESNLNGEVFNFKYVDVVTRAINQPVLAIPRLGCWPFLV